MAEEKTEIRKSQKVDESPIEIYMPGKDVRLLYILQPFAKYLIVTKEMGGCSVKIHLKEDAMRKAAEMLGIMETPPDGADGVKR